MMTRLPDINDTDRRLYLSAVLALWQRGMNTHQIGKTLRDPEYHVERALHEALELQRCERKS